MKLSIKTAIKFCLTITFIMPSAFVFSSQTTKAASVIADSPCDPDYYKSLSARAWLEAQREITQNQNIILKPDSVFEYTCFDRLVFELADHADEMFSETNKYGAPLGSDSMDNALESLVITPLISYIDGNFGSKSSDGYNLLAGHTAATGINHQPKSLTNTTSYNCDIMSRVWKAAKCINFTTNTTEDGFFTFDEYKDSIDDKRILPSTCASIQDSWSNNLKTALTEVPWINDSVDTYFDKTEPQDCGSGDSTCKCEGDPVPTGVTVVRTGYNVNEYPEKICIQPGCHYHPGTVDGKTDDLTPNVTGPSSEGCYGL